MGPQFLHIENYAPKGAHKKNSSERKNSMFDIHDELTRLPHACSQGPWPCTRYDHRGAPVLKSNATTDFRYAPGCSHDSVKPP